MAAITSSIGVIRRRPFSTVKSLSPSYRVGRVEQGSGQPDHDVVRRVAVLALRLEHVSRRHQQDEAEQVEDPGELVDEGGAEEDEAGPSNEREDDPEEQDLLLVGAGNPEAGHDDEEDEEVVDRERLLGDVPSEVLGPGLRAAEHEDADTEQQRDADVQRRPRGRLAQRRRVGLADVEVEVEEQQPADRHDGQRPHEWRDGHPGISWCRGSREGRTG
jgi:hypothetical protein